MFTGTAKVASDLHVDIDRRRRHFDRGYEAGLPILRRALDVFGIGMSVDEQLRCHWMAGVVASHLWDDDRWHLLSERHVELARGFGALSELPLALSSRAFTMMFAGDLTGAACLVGEIRAAMDATGSHLAPYPGLGVAALRGRQAEAAALLDATIRDVNLRGEGIGIALAEWANAVLNNGLGSYETAMQAAQRATSARWKWWYWAGRRPSSSRRQCAADTMTSPPTRCASWPGGPHPVAPTGRAASRRVPARC